jgi:hypothetical protein
MTTCHVDSTIALPMLAQALAEKFKHVRRNIPVFDWTGDTLRITFQRFKA